MIGTVWSRILADRVAAIAGIDATSFDASTTVDVEAAAGQKVVPAASTTGLTVGQMVMIGDGTASEEVGRIASISSGVSITLAANLANTQAVGVVVSQGWYHNTCGSTTVRTWNAMLLLQGHEMKIGEVACAIRSIQDARVSVDAGPREHRRRSVIVVMFQQVAELYPIDQKNDTAYEELVHDFLRAWFADWSCGGEADMTTLETIVPISHIGDIDGLDENIEDRFEEFPGVGFVAQVDVDYTRSAKDAYQ